MFHRHLLASAALALAALAGAPIAMAQDAAHPGKAVYDQRCASCHNTPGATPGTERAAQLVVLRATPEMQLRAVLTGDGKMAPMAAGLSGQQIDQLVGWLTAEQVAAPAAWDEALMCSPDNRVVDVSRPVSMPYYGVDNRSTRSLSAKQAGLKKKDIKNLEVSYVVGYPRTQALGTGIASMGDTVFVNAGGKLMAMDANEGCARWIYAGSGSRTTPNIADIGGRKAVVFSNGNADVVAIDAATGEEMWKASGQPTNVAGSIRGSVLVYKDKVIVPISASGVATGMNGKFECCTGHGAVVALNAADGSKLWEYHTMKDAEYNGFISPSGVKQKGPSGAPIWSTPTIDEKRNAVIVTTGENTSYPATHTSDAVISLDLDTGAEKWVYQAMEKDVWNMACRSGDEDSGSNCPWHFDQDNIGRDFDFGGPAILVNVKGNAFGLGGRDVLLAGQKSGHIWALDAETGQVIWGDRVGVGSPLGGNHWGIAADNERVYLTIADSIPSSEGAAAPGVYAYRIKDGKRVWEYQAKPQCGPTRAARVTNCESKFGFSATPLVIDGVLAAATLDGKLFFFDGKTGKLLKSFDTIRDFETKNGIPGAGGSIDSHAVSAGAGHVFITSGYGSFGQTPGNVLIALAPKK